MFRVLVLKMLSQTISSKRNPSMLYKIMPLHIDMIPVMQNHIRAVVNIRVSESAQLPRVITANYNKILQNPTVWIDLNFW